MSGAGATAASGHDAAGAAEPPRTVPFFRPAIGDAECDAAVECLRSGWLTGGPRVRRFEDRFAGYVGAEHAVAVNSCTAALHLTLTALGVGPGDEVILPTMTYVATAEAAVRAGATPVLVDSNPDLGIDPAAVERALTPRTRAIVPVHYAGHPCAMADLLTIAEEAGVEVVDDAAHALPARSRGLRIGSLGTATCFSFHASKTLTTGEGGMITTDDPAIAERARRLRNHGLSADTWSRHQAGAGAGYQVVEAGYKCTMSDIAAAIGLAQLDRCDDLAADRKRIATIYDDLLTPVPEVEPLAPADRDASAWHLYVVRIGVDAPLSRDELRAELARRGIDTQVHYEPLHTQPYYRDRWGYGPEDLPVALEQSKRVLSLPLFPEMAREDVAYVSIAVRDALDAARR